MSGIFSPINIAARNAVERKVTCPTCGARPGESCFRPSGVTTDNTHSARIKASRKGKARAKVAKVSGGHNIQQLPKDFPVHPLCDKQTIEGMRKIQAYLENAAMELSGMSACVWADLTNNFKSHWREVARRHYRLLIDPLPSLPSLERKTPPRASQTPKNTVIETHTRYYIQSKRRSWKDWHFLGNAMVSSVLAGVTELEALRKREEASPSRKRLKYRLVKVTTTSEALNA